MIENAINNIYSASNTLVDITNSHNEAFEYSKEINKESHQQMLKNK